LKFAEREIMSLKDAKSSLETKIEHDKPKVLFADAVSASESTILIGELAKLLRGNGAEIGQNRLFERLRGDGYLIRRAGRDYNMPSQRAMEMGLFKIKEAAITHSDGHISISKTTLVTGKGQQYFANKFLGRDGATKCIAAGAEASRLAAPCLRAVAPVAQ
jgi:anti-repressor protein